MEKRKLENLVSQRDSKISNLIKKEDIDHNKNHLNPEDSAATASTCISSVSSNSNIESYYTSMIAHWNSLPIKKLLDVKLSHFNGQTHHQVAPANLFILLHTRISRYDS